MGLLILYPGPKTILCGGFLLGPNARIDQRENHAETACMLYRIHDPATRRSPVLGIMGDHKGRQTAQTCLIKNKGSDLVAQFGIEL